MKLVKNFLSRFKNLTPPDDALRRVIAAVVSDVARVPVTRTDVKIQNNIAFVKCSSIAKSVIRTSRAMILAGIIRELPHARGLVRDIR